MGRFDFPSPSVASTVVDAAAGTKGIVQLAGDLTGSAAAPEVVGSIKAKLGNRVFFVGDSITAYGISDTNADGTGSTFAPLLQARSWPAVGMMASEGRIVYGGQAATGGYTTALILSTHVPTAVASDAKAVVHLAGRNDIVLSVAFATTVANLKASYAAYVAAGKLPVLCTLSAANGNTTAQKLATSKLNAWIREYAAANNYPLVDFAAATTDPTTGAWPTGHNADNSHPLPPGARVMGAELNTKLAPVLPPYKPLHALHDSAGPSESVNMWTNPLWLRDTNADGVPDGMTKSGTAAGTTTTPAAAGDGVGNWFKMVRTGGTGSLLHLSDLMTVAPGERVAFSFRFKTVNVESTAVLVACRLVGVADAAGNLLAPVQYVAGVTQWKGDLATPGLFYQETVIASGVTRVGFVLSISGGTNTELHVGQILVANLTASGSLT